MMLWEWGFSDSSAFLAISEIIFPELDYQLTENLCFKQNWNSSEKFATTFLMHLQPRKLLYTYNWTCLVYTCILQRLVLCIIHYFALDKYKLRSLRFKVYYLILQLVIFLYQCLVLLWISCYWHQTNCIMIMHAFYCIVLYSTLALSSENVLHRNIQPTFNLRSTYILNVWFDHE